MPKELDCRGLRCPMPIVQVSLAVKQMPAGDMLYVQATDPAFRPDLMAWAERGGHAVVEFHEGDVQRAVIRKGGEGDGRG